MAKYDEFGREIPDPRPVEVPLQFRRPKTLNEIVGEELARQIRRAAEEQGQESFEEADDFDIDDEEEHVSPYEMTMMQEEFRMPADQELEKPSEKQPAAAKGPRGEDSAAPEPQGPGLDDAGEVEKGTVETSKPGKTKRQS